MQAYTKTESSSGRCYLGFAAQASRRLPVTRRMSWTYNLLFGAPAVSIPKIRCLGAAGLIWVSDNMHNPQDLRAQRHPYRFLSDAGTARDKATAHARCPCHGPAAPLVCPGGPIDSLRATPLLTTRPLDPAPLALHDAPGAQLPELCHPVASQHTLRRRLTATFLTTP